ncbi:hypothetical protein C7999DRAFT_18550 [Corynascus novoguineensis]|uniref:Uncharacterized protein n=1 Tax=Corynascus novoguineensis TaxID=1126955 RepID=A0AAN7CKM6_9PEZI|nr:hypothetical protein C7999DRAFT_18550 [Corynascus novoguineensis]
MSPCPYYEDDEPGARLPPIQHGRSHFTSRRTSIWGWLSLCLAVFTLTSFFWGILLLQIRRSCHSQVDKNIYSQPKATEPGHNFKSHARYISCGKSIAESKSLGCKYDILSNHWVPWQCMDDGSVEIYQSDGSWFGFADENRTQLIGSAEGMGSTEVYYTNMRDHIVHCAALWKKQFNAFFEERVYYDSLILDPKHTYHCADFLVDMTDKGPDFRNIPIKVEVGHAGCWVREKGCSH